MTHKLGPLPDTELSEVRNNAINQTRLSETGAAYFGSNWREVRKLYTAEQLRAYALAEVEKAVKADADRLDWLQHQARTCTIYMDGQHPWSFANHKLRSLQGPTLRDAIDAAMKVGK